jgi:hypothetical protein
MACPVNPNPRTIAAGRRMQQMYSKQFGRRCEDCGQDALGRRMRCRVCKLLVCWQCIYTKHGINCRVKNGKANTENG